MFKTILSGGPVMIPIMLCSIIAVAIVIERIWALRRSRIFPPENFVKITNLISRGEFAEALTMCRRTRTPMTNIIHAGLLQVRSGRDEIRKAVEEAGRLEMPVLERRLDWLSICASVAPLVGLLGTVTGMIRVFRVLAVEGPGNPHSLSTGISEALVTTAAGLIVAIPTLVFYHYLAGRADRLMEEMERQSINVVHMISSREHVVR